MSPGIAILLVASLALLFLNVPVAFVLGAATLLATWALGYGDVPLSFASDLGNGIDSFALLAIPFFILAGELMGAGGLARRLIRFAAALVGRRPGGLAVVNTLTCMLFGSISGSAAAAISSIGGTLIPEMNRQGYARDFNIAVTACAATTGLIIPPSNVMIIYALVASNISVAALFIAGIVPGIVIGLGIMAVGFFIARARGYGAAVNEEPPPFWPSLAHALPSLLLVVVVLGGILGGVFTATEASAVAVLWAFLLGVVCYREIALRDLTRLAINAARTTGIVLFLVATSYALSRLLTLEQIPQQASTALLELTSNPIVLLILINLFLLGVGTIMDITAALLIFTPIFLPVAIGAGLHPIHFGIIMIANLCIGLLTPPVGTCLFVGAGVGGSDIVRVSRAMLPFYAVMVVTLLLITYLPALSLWLPEALGQLK